MSLIGTFAQEEMERTGAEDIYELNEALAAEASTVFGTPGHLDAERQWSLERYSEAELLAEIERRQGEGR